MDFRKAFDKVDHRILLEKLKYEPDNNCCPSELHISLRDICQRSVDSLNDAIIRFTNCHILKDERLVREDLWICNGVVLDGLKLFYHERRSADVCVNADGTVISPGFIDVQINGSDGWDFSNPEQDITKACEEVSQKLPSTGVTAFCPTIITSSQQAYRQIIPRLRNYQDKPQGARVLGIHLEGPFIHEEHAGMHPKDLIQSFGIDPVKTLKEAYGENMDLIRMVTIAPELPGSMKAIEELVSRNIVVSIGHTNANCHQLKDAVASGATFVTHLFNAMPKFNHRHSHLMGTVTHPDPSLYVGIIADLIHVNASGLRVAEAIAPGRVVLVTDANPATNLVDGTYKFGVQSIEINEGRAYVAGTETIAGSTTSMPICVRNYWLHVTKTNAHDWDLGLEKWPGLGRALSAASTRPARGMCFHQKPHSPFIEPRLTRGSLEFGAAADLVFIDQEPLGHPIMPEVKVLSTWINGKPVFYAKESS